MADEGFKRKLTAILSADVEGYSRLMDDDEEATVRTLTVYRTAIADLVQQYHGRVVDSPGDNILAEFTSVVDAVNCGVKIQGELTERNADLPNERKMQFRIGVNLGDVIDEEERIYGDGVNIAARIESLSDAGGICISHSAYDQIKNKLKLGFEYLGEHKVKNIREPIKAYRVLMAPEFEGKLIGFDKKASKIGWVWAAAAAIVVAVVGLGIWQFYMRRPTVEPASVEKMAYPLPDKPSIAVLPFDNMSEDPEQGYFCDGLTEEIITSLSKVPQIFVIARNSVFIYKGKPVRVKQVAEDLGVQYVLEGSVRKAGDKIRITAQLIDALSGHHLWAERYDRNLEEIFVIQDDLTKNIIAGMQVQLTEGEQARIDAKGTKSLEAYLKYLRADNIIRQMNIESNAQAKQLAQEAIDLDPEYAMAYRALAAGHRMDVYLGASKSPKQSMATCRELLEKAIELDPNYAEALAALGFTYSGMGKHDKAVATAERAVALDPNAADVHTLYAHTLRFANRPEEAIPEYKKAIRLNPIPPSYYFFGLGMAYSLAGQHQEAIKWCEKAVRQDPNSFMANLILTAIYSMAGRDKEARTQAEEVLRLNPKYHLERDRKRATARYKDKWFAALSKAGFPEHPPLPLPDNPSIAVLAFDNLSGDPEQEYFSDGITEEIISSLSKTDKLFVIARNSTFTYKGKPVNVKQVARELGVRYVLEGSLRKSEDRVRITAQLIDATTGHHLWSERYDRDLKDIFALQDEITMKIVMALQIKLTEGEQARMWAKQYKNLDEYLKVMEATALFRKGTEESIIRVGQIGQEFIDKAPESPIGYKMLAWYNWYISITGQTFKESMKKAFIMAQKALSLDDSDASGHALLATIYTWMRQFDKAIAAGGQSIVLDPNGALGHINFGSALCYAGRIDEGIDQIKQAIRLNPFPEYLYYYNLGRCYRQKGQYKKSLSEFKKALRRSPDNVLNHASLAAIYALLDRQDEAEAAAKKVLEIYPNFSVERSSKTWPYKNQNDIRLFADALRKAGLPE